MDVLVGRTCITSVILSSSLNTVFEISRRIDEYELTYRWYARARYYRAHTDPLDFLNYI